MFHKIKFILMMLLLSSFLGFAQNDKKAYIFTYFKNNGEDGLHMAYSYNGLKWVAFNGDSATLKPSVGVDKLMRDPCVIVGGDGLFHMVWTTGWKDKGIGYAYSKDMVNWSKQEYLPLMHQVNGAMNCWAPEISYDRKSDRYIIYWATTITGRFTSQSFQTEKDHRIYYVSTKEFKKFTKPKILYDQGFNVIDASIHSFEHGYIMFLKDETIKPKPEKNIRIAFSRNIDEHYGKPSIPITGNYWAEGPTPIKIGKEWIVYFDKYKEHKYGAVKSIDLIKWEDISSALDMPIGVRHGTVLEISKSVLDNLLAKIP